MKKIFRKKILAFFLSALLVLALSLPVFADMGPKPSVTLKLYYTPGQRYAVTLLGNTALNGPWTAPADYRERMGSREAWEAFRNYPAPEGYYFLGYFQEYPGTADEEFVWGYYPPNKFYVLLYNIETGTLPQPGAGGALCLFQRVAGASRFPRRPAGLPQPQRF